MGGIICVYSPCRSVARSSGMKSLGNAPKPTHPLLRRIHKEIGPTDYRAGLSAAKLVAHVKQPNLIGCGWLWCFNFFAPDRVTFFHYLESCPYCNPPSRPPSMQSTGT